MTKLEIEIFDTTKGEFPKTDENGNHRSISFFWDGDIYTGWPLVDDVGTHRSDKWFTPIDLLNEAPLDVTWEASEDRVTGAFKSVRYWFYTPSVRQVGGE